MNPEQPGQYENLVTRLQMLRGVSPEQREQMLRAGVIPEEMDELRRSRDSEEGRLRGQIDQAYSLANAQHQTPSTSNVAQVANIIANTLRSFGGYAIASDKERDLAAAQAEGAKKRDALMKELLSGRRAAKEAEVSGLESATGGGIPFYLRNPEY